MKTLILYSTKHGCTEKCAKVVSEKLTGKVDLFNLKLSKNIDISQYDKVIIGGSIYMSKIQKEVNSFCIENLNTLNNKKIGLFICCMRDVEKVEMELQNYFPQELAINAVAKECFGGEFIFKNMNFIERLIVKKVSKIEKDISSISNERINNFVRLMNNV